MLDNPTNCIVQSLIVPQLVLTALLGFICFICFDATASKSAVLGGVVCVIPNWYAARRVFSRHAVQTAKKIVNSFYRAQAMKFCLAMILFAVVFTQCNVNPVTFFLAYIAVQMLIWFVPLLIKNNNRQ